MKCGLLLLGVLAVLPCLAFGADSLGSAAAKEVITVVAIEDHVYGSIYSEAQGELLYLVKAISAKAGYDIKVKFLPWNEAINQLRSNPEIDAIVGLYFTELRNEVMLFSIPITTDKIGFVRSIKLELKWDQLTDLASYKIGLIAGYPYESNFDQLVFSERLNTKFYLGAVSMLTDLSEGKIQLAAISKRTYDYLTLQHTEIAKASHKLMFDTKLLTERPLHIAFKRDDAHETIRVKLNNAISSLKLDQLSQQYWLRLKPQSDL